VFGSTAGCETSDIAVPGALTHPDGG
jgi:hypothetical protein